MAVGVALLSTGLLGAACSNFEEIASMLSVFDNIDDIEEEDGACLASTASTGICDKLFELMYSLATLEPVGSSIEDGLDTAWAGDKGAAWLNIVLDATD